MNWIDIKDGYPEEDGMLVVVFDPYNHPLVWPARWDARNKAFDSNGGWFEKDEVTHWMPLPPPPKSKAWLEGFAAADYDEKADPTVHDYTHNPYQPTSPWTYPDAHAGPPTKEAADWEAGYHFRQFDHQRLTIQCKVTIGEGENKIETYL